MNKQTDPIKPTLILLFTMMIIFALLGACHTSQKTVTTKVHSINKPIEGQIETAQSLKKLMDEKKYDQAIQLFSEKQQASIQEIKQKDGMFDYWCLAWTMDQMKLDRYISRIKDGRGNFVFEEDRWKIDEK